MAAGPQAGSGFFKGLFGVIGPEIERHANEAEAAKKAQADVYLQGIQSGRLTPEQADYALKQIQKLYGHSKPIKEILGKVGGVIQKLSGRGNQQQGGGKTAEQALPGPQPPQPPQASAAQALPGPQAAPKSASDALPAPKPNPLSFAGVAGAAFPNPDVEAAKQDQRALDLFEKESKIQHQNRLEEISKQNEGKVGWKAVGAAQKVVGPDGKTHLQQEFMLPDGTTVFQDRGEAGATSSGRAYAGPAISVTNARLLAKQGRKFEDEQGIPIDIEQLPDDMGLKAFTMSGKVFYIPFDPNQTTVTVGNEVYAVGPWEKKGIGQGQGTALGPKQVPTSTAREAIAVNPVTGEVTTNVLHGSRTPTTTGARGRQTPPTSAPPAPVGTPTRTAPPAGQVPRGTPAAPQAGGGRVLNPPVSMYNQMLQRVTAVREANTQIFGDPTQPKVKSLQDFGSLASDPKSQERLRTALQLALQEQAKLESSSSFMQLAKNYTGITQAVAESNAAVRQQAIQGLTPEEQDYFDSVMNAYSTIVGLRSLTKASAAQFSVTAIERELPLIGINATNPRQFYDQLSRLAEVVYNGTRGVPPSFFNPEELERIRKAPTELQQKKATAPSGAQKVLPKPGKAPSTADEYLKSIQK